VATVSRTTRSLVDVGQRLLEIDDVAARPVRMKRFIFGSTRSGAEVDAAVETGACYDAIAYSCPHAALSARLPIGCHDDGRPSLLCPARTHRVSSDDVWMRRGAAFSAVGSVVTPENGCSMILSSGGTPLSRAPAGGGPTRCCLRSW